MVYPSAAIENNALKFLRSEDGLDVVLERLSGKEVYLPDQLPRGHMEIPHRPTRSPTSLARLIGDEQKAVKTTARLASYYIR